MPVKRLKVNMGFIEGTAVAPTVDSAGDTRLVRRALLVYEGEFMAMDGEVKVTREDLERVVSNHNALIMHRSALAGGLDPMCLQPKDYPPLQLDHSNSARDTVGRLIGTIELGPYIRQDGQEVLGIYGNVCFLGAENCERASDGRYTHLSVGVDFEKGLFSELTVTPFPAASEASLLSEKRLAKWHKENGSDFGLINCEAAEGEGKSGDAFYLIVGQKKEGGNFFWEIIKAPATKVKGGAANSKAAAKQAAESAASGNSIMLLGAWKENSELARLADGYMKKEVSYKGYKFEVIRDEAGRWLAFFGHREFAGGSEQEVVAKVHKYIDVEQLSKNGEIPEDTTKLSQGEQMEEELKKRLKKHLTEEKKMSEEEAEKHLSHLSSEEGKEEMSKLSAEVDEHDKKLAAEEEEKSKLAAEEKEKEEKEEKLKRMSAAQASIKRLASDFRSAFEGSQLAAKKGRILTRLSKLRAEAKITPAEVKKIELDKLSAQTEATIEAVLKTYEDREPVIQTGALGSIKAEEIHSLSKSVRMSRLEEETRANMSLLKKTASKDGKDGVRRLAKMEDVNVHIDTTPHTHLDLSAEEAEIGRLMDEGKKEEAKLKMRECLKKALSYGASSGSSAQLSSEETEKQLSALAEATKKMQTSYEELQKLTASLVGN